MTSPTTNKFSPEVRDRAVRMVLDHEGEHPSRWAAISSIAGKIGCSPHTLLEWVKKADRDSGRSPGVPRRQRRFPAHAGMVPLPIWHGTRACWFPRLHGGWSLHGDIRRNRV